MIIFSQLMISFFGKLLIFSGGLLVLIGALILVASKIPFLGKLPGDILIKKKGFVFYAPFATSIKISILLSLIFYLISRLLK